MAKVIIGIHGLGNKPSKNTLRKWWKKSMLEGLKNMQHKNKLPKFELIYWADLLYEKPLNESIKNEDHPLYVKEIYIEGKEPERGLKHPLKKKFLDWFDIAADKIFLNDDMTVNYSFISSAFIHNYFKDLEAYYENGEIKKNGQVYLARDQIRGRLIEVLKKYDGYDIFLVAHSMGSIVAFDVLTFNLPEIKIKTFATIGSPLGIPFVRSKIAQEKRLVLNDSHKLKTPKGVQQWYNFSDLEDDVTINYSLEKDFEENEGGVRAVDFIVNNNYEIDKEKNPHKSFGYLRTPEFSEILFEFIQKEKGLVQIVKDFFREVKQKL